MRKGKVDHIISKAWEKNQIFNKAKIRNQISNKTRKKVSAHQKGNGSKRKP